MPYLFYSYQLKRRLPLLDEREWVGISALLQNRIQSIMEYRKENDCSLEEALRHDPGGKIALDAYQELAGLRLEHSDQLYAVQLSKYGRPCPQCGRLFRTPNAHFCVECGFELPKGEVAGSVSLEELSQFAVNIDRYKIFYDDQFVGESRLEYGDPPMGIALGKFIPSSGFMEIRKTLDVTLAQDHRRWEGFYIQTADGKTLQCESGVVIIEYGDAESPFEIEVTCLGIPAPTYEHLFPHHIETYKNSF